METAICASRRKALKGVIREIEHNCTMSLIRARVENEDICVSSRLPKEEVARMDLKVGDNVDIFPIDLETYLIVSKS
ncbi:MAG: TOBE domain-containing protein [Candidatus Omnitrophica bacterium]|nr:TOBE domain-containing protein [Candidatus Omnitrophota bacterium]